MQAKFKRERPFGKERFRGLVVWFGPSDLNPNGVKHHVKCNRTHTTKKLALADAAELLATLKTKEWANA